MNRKTFEENDHEKSRLALLIAISAMTAGTVISAPTGAQVVSTARSIKPSDPGDSLQPRAEEAPIVETIKISGGQSGDNRSGGFESGNSNPAGE
jgi:hypothetical protein